MVDRRHEQVVLDDETREALGGTYARLSDGHTHYFDEGPRGGPAVVLIHGGTLPSAIFQGTASALVDAGMRVIRFDGYGRGRSDRPARAHDLALFNRQVGELIDHLDVGRCRLVGYSLGGPVAASYAAQNPGRIEKVTLVAPVVRYSRHRPLVFLAGLPGVGPAVIRAVGMARMETRTRETLGVHEEGDAVSRAFSEQTRIRGFRRSMSSMSWHMVRRDFSEEYARFGGLGIETDIFRGSADGEVRLAEIDQLMQSIPHASYSEQPEATHAIMLDRKGRTRADLVASLRAVSRAPVVRMMPRPADDVAAESSPDLTASQQLELAGI